MVKIQIELTEDQAKALKRIAQSRRLSSQSLSGKRSTRSLSQAPSLAAKKDIKVRWRSLGSSTLENEIFRKNMMFT
jgi:hypothetical protein